MPSACSSALNPSANATPSPSPTSEATRPSARDSSSTDRSTCRREAPSVRRVANSRARWATVIESVLKITKAPTNRATAPKPSRNSRMKCRNFETSLPSAFACSAPVFTCADAGRIRLISPARYAGATPGFAATEIES